MKFKASCPIRAGEQVWIEESMRWLVAEFGEHVLRGQLIMPTDDFFPGAYAGTVTDVQRVIELVRRRMGVAEYSFVVELADTGDDWDDRLPGYRRTSGPAGEYRSGGEHGIVSISMRQARSPMALVATIAHELCHHRLMGEYRVDARRPDNEPLTDLATVLFGFGIFSANASLDFGRTAGIGSGGQAVAGWRVSRLGYLTEPMFGYALAYYAFLRGDRDVLWARHVDTNPRAYLKKGLRYLHKR